MRKTLTVPLMSVIGRERIGGGILRTECSIRWYRISSEWVSRSITTDSAKRKWVEKKRQSWWYRSETTSNPDSFPINLSVCQMRSNAQVDLFCILWIPTPLKSEMHQNGMRNSNEAVQIGARSFGLFSVLWNELEIPPESIFGRMTDWQVLDILSIRMTSWVIRSNCVIWKHNPRVLRNHHYPTESRALLRFLNEVGTDKLVSEC